MTAGTNTEPTARVSTSRSALRRVEKWWQATAAVSIAVLVWWYVMVHRQPSANRYRGLEMPLGWIGIGLALAAAILSVRKRWAYQGMFKLSSWMSAHVYVGVIAAVAILLHSGFHAGTLLTASLVGFFWLTIASGLLGWFMSRKIPPLLTAMEEKPAILEDLLAVRAECVGGMLELAAGGSGEFRALINQRLMKETVSWQRMLRFYKQRSTVDQELPDFQKEYDPTRFNLREHEHRAFRRAVDYALLANKMNAELFLQRLMRGWLTLHLLSTAAMFGLAAFHTFSVLYYY